MIKTNESNILLRHNKNSLKHLILNNNIIFLIITTFIIFIPVILTGKKGLEKLNLISEIIITINGEGNQQILSKDFNQSPDEILINGELQNIIQFQYYLNNTENIIILRWNSPLTNCKNMFYQLSNIIKINFSNFDSGQVTTMSYMFKDCNSLKSIYFNNIDTSSVKNMAYMFYGCSSLTTLDLSNFNTSSVTNINYMFNYCSSLISLDLSKFDTSSVVAMSNLFRGCSSLILLNLDNFNTSSINYLSNMFDDCFSLTSLNLSSFDLSKITYITEMFHNCYSLKTLEFNNYHNCNIIKMDRAFYNCSSLISLNLGNFILSESTLRESVFDFINKDIIYCIKDNILLNEFLKNEINLQNNCSDYCFDKSKKIIMEKNKCILNCSEDNLYKFEFNKRCFSFCPNGTHNSSNIKYYCELDYKNDNLNNQTEYYSDFNSDLTQYNNNSNYYTDNILDSITNIHDIHDNYSTIYYSDSTLDYTNIINKNDSMIYNTDFTIKPIINYTTYLNLEHTSKTTIDHTFESRTSYYIKDHNDFTTYYYSNISILNNTNYIQDNSFNNESNYNNIIKFLENKFPHDKIDSLISNLIEGEKEDIIIKEKDSLYVLTSLYNQNNKIYDNISNIIFGECENILKNKYNISKNQTLLILKKDIYQKDALIPIINYELFNPTTKEQLDLSLCKNKFINISIPISIDEDNIFKYDPKSEYYTDVCYPYTSINGTDILLNDRYDEYNNKNMSVCENNCTLKKYDINTKKVECECEIKYEKNIFSETNQTDLLYYNFDKKNLSSNMALMKCSYTLFTKEGILSNIASYLLIFFILFFIISAILFYKCGYPLLEDEIKEIIESKQKKNIKRRNIEETQEMNIKIFLLYN